jgi:hypothetical protein
MFKRFLFGCLFLLSLSTCRKDKEANVIVNIADDFYIDMFENISNGEQRFELKVSTIAMQSCLNYLIDYDVTIDKESHTIELIINDLITPGDCLEGSSSAKLTVPFGYLPVGFYIFNINLKNAVFNTGRLAVFEDQYLLEMNTDYGIEIVNDLLYRIPQNTLWGYVAYANSSSTTAGENFLSDFENLNSINSVEGNTLYPFGYYGYFDLQEDNKIVLSKKINANHHIPFLFQNTTNDVSAVRALVGNACADNNLDIHIFTEYGLDINCE